MRRLAAACLVLALASGALRAEVPDLDAQVADARDLFLAGDHAAGLVALQPAAAAGHPRAQNIVASAYQYGLGLPVNATLAVQSYEAAAAQGYPPAIYNLGVLFRDGMPGLAADPVRGRDQFRQAAALDYAAAQAAYAVMLLNGVGGPADPVEARRMFDRAGSLGDPYAHDWLGWLYRSGTEGYPADPVAARDHYMIAALQNIASAQNSLGEMIELGEGGPADPQAALGWYDRAVGNDEAYAGINAAWAIFDNPDLFTDRVRGLAYCFWAVEIGTPEQQAEWRPACNGMRADFTPDEIRAAEKLAAGL